MSNVTNQNGEIINGLRADVMRSSIENKNLLTKKGSLYVGTGLNTTIQTGSNTYSVPITEELVIGEDENHSVLAVKNIGDGVEYSKIYPSMIEENSEKWNITCTRANHVIGDSHQARYAKYASSDHSKGTIEERLFQMENQISNVCGLFYDIQTKSGRQGSVILNNITKCFNTVIMRLKIEGAYLTKSKNGTDSLRIWFPTQYRPKGCPTIFATISTRITTSGDSEDGEASYTEAYDPMPCTVPIKVRPDTSIYIDADTVKNSRTRVEDRNSDRSSYEMSSSRTAILDILATWNIEEPTIDICLATDNTSTTTKIWVRLGMVEEAEVLKIRLYRVSQSSTNNWMTYETNNLVDEIPGYYSSTENIKYASFTVPRYSIGSYCKAELIYKAGISKPNICTGEVYIEK